MLTTDFCGEVEVIDLYHPTLPLGIQVRVYPLDPEGELVADLAAMPDEYNLEAPDGAQSNGVGWIDENYNGIGWHRSVYWFAANQRLFEIQMTAPDDIEWLDVWSREFLLQHFKLIPPAHAS